jgi:hypothetical protein
MEGRVVAAPLFSLIGGTRTHRPLLLTLLARSGIAPLEFMETILCRQFSRLWLELWLSFGLLPEAHAQNLLVNLSPSLVPDGTFYYRDFDGLLIDWVLRRARGLPQPSEMPCSWTWYQTYETPFPGVPYCELVSWKAKVSLHAYVHYVLDAFNLKLQEWQATGIIGGKTIYPGSLAATFSRHVVRDVESLFGVLLPGEFDLHLSFHKCLILLLKLRKELVSGRIQYNSSVPRKQQVDSNWP